MANWKEVVEALPTEADGFRWIVNHCGHIRAEREGGHTFCPLTALHYATRKEFLTISDYYDAIDALGIESDAGYAIVDAADNDAEAKREVREAILAKLGLTEVDA
jgi:hypothetical protein